MSQEKKQKKRAFTLIETLIYVFIFSLFIIGAVSFGSSMTSSRLRNQTVLEVNDQGSKVMKIITQTIRNASQVNSPTISNTASNLSLVTYTPVTSPTVFSATGGILYMTEGAGVPVALTNNKVIISNLSFSNLSRPGTPDIIKISFTLASQASSTSLVGSYTSDFNGSANLRK